MALSELRSRLAAWIAPERRAVDPMSLYGLTGSVAAPGVTTRVAESIATVTACVHLTASSLAYLPFRMYRAGRVRSEVLEHPLYTMMREGPNDRQTWPDLVESTMASALLHGNALVVVERQGDGEVTALRFIPWTWVMPVMLPSGRLAYDVTEGGMTGAPGRRYRLLSGPEVIHLRDRSDDGILGVSRLRRAASTMQAAASANDFASAFLGNGAFPAGAITHDEDLTIEAVMRLSDSFEAGYAGARKAGRVLILGGGMKFTPFQISPEDAELLATRKFMREEICAIYMTPPPLVQDYSHNTFTNSETAGRWFAQFTLAPWARKIEAEFGRALFPAGSGLELEIDLSGFLRGDPQTRWAAHKIAVDAGILTADEVREIEGFNPKPAGAVVA
ncbi:MAG: phage portal protein [Sandarakinorhabdus sp.]|nr:phage portal protein [Sandarakinorhabdus sp.]